MRCTEYGMDENKKFFSPSVLKQRRVQLIFGAYSVRVWSGKVESSRRLESETVLIQYDVT